MITTATKRRTGTKTDTIRALQARESREAPELAAAAGETKGTGWTVFGYLIAGMVAYGGIGWLIGKATHDTVLFPVGMLAGLAISLGFVIYRYGMQGQQQSQGSKEGNQTVER